MIKVIRRRHHLPLLCALLLCLLTNPGGALGYIWCIGADGHSHATATTDSSEDCHQDTPPYDHDRTLSATTADHDQCLHIAITSQLGRDGNRNHQPLGENAPMARAAVLAAFSLLPEQCLTNGLIPQPPPRIAEPLLHHRTTVLLI